MPRKNKGRIRVKCIHCGNNPVPHFLYWYYESFGILLVPLRQFILFNPISEALKKIWAKNNLAWLLVRLFVFLKICTLQKDIGKCKIPRAIVLWEEAEERGIKMYELLFFGRPFDVYVAEKKTKKKGKGNRLLFSGLPRPVKEYSRFLDVMDDKAALKKVFQNSNLPVPKGASCFTFGQAKKVFSSVGKPVIVKPRTGSRGRHSTVNVNTVQDLKQAYKIAKKLNFFVVVEEQLTGPVYRATLINFELCGVLRGDPPQVVGDGQKNVRQLIEEKNRTKNSTVKEVVINASLEKFVQRQILNSPTRLSAKRAVAGEQPLTLGQALSPNLEVRHTLNFILPKNFVLNLSGKIGVGYGGSSSEDFDICHKDNKQLFVQAAKKINQAIVGFDFIIPDITKSWKEQKCGFIEANSLPFINLHHDPLHGRPKNVASKVWDMVNFFKKN